MIASGSQYSVNSRQMIYFAVAALIKIQIFSNMTPCRRVSSHRRFGGVFCPLLQDISNSRRLEEPLVTYRVFVQIHTNIMASKNHKTFHFWTSPPRIISVWSTVRTCKGDVTLVPHNAEDFVNSWATIIFWSRSFPDGYRSFSYCLFSLLIKSFAIVVTSYYVGYSESKYRLRISLAHPRDCHFAHVQWLSLSIEKPQTPFREIRVMFMFVLVR